MKHGTERSGIVLSCLALMLSACAATFGESGTGKEVPLRLEYSYNSGEPHWARFGALMQRQFALFVQDTSMRQLGIVRTFSDDSPFSLVRTNDTGNYFKKAAATVLIQYGVVLNSASPYRLVLALQKISVGSVEQIRDGMKQCSIDIAAELFGPHNSSLFSARVSNKGTDVCGDDDDRDYSRLIDKTLHGAIVKIWASQALFTQKVLGSGRIEKLAIGTYGFISDSLHAAEGTDTVAAHVSRSVDVSENQLPGFSQTQAYPGSTSNDAGPLYATYSDRNDSVAISGGKKVAIGVLPFQNATGSERLQPAMTDAHDQFVRTLTASSTVRVMERERLADILKEQALGMSGIMADSTAVKIGNISGVKAMIAGRLTTVGSYYRLNARVINCETSAIVTAATVDVPDVLGIADAGPLLASKVLEGFTREKVQVNQNAMSYPSICPMAIGATTASTEDAWAVTTNPANLMKLKRRDASFFISFAGQLDGTYNAQKVSTQQPAYSNIGINFGIPLSSRTASGLSIRHVYPYPSLKSDSAGIGLKEETTLFTVPFAFGFNPMVSVGANINVGLAEYQLTAPSTQYREGNVTSMDGTVGLLLKFADRFKLGITYSSAGFLKDAREKTGSDGEFKTVDRETPVEFRVGTAMYPLKWLFLFADLQYEKYPSTPQTQPGFYLGAQLTHYGRIFNIRPTPAYGMLPLYIGYWHEPYNRITSTQARYFSIGTGYFVNNVYFRWSMRYNVEPSSERITEIGDRKSNVRLTDYSFYLPLFLTIGYQF